MELDKNYPVKINNFVEGKHFHGHITGKLVKKDAKKKKEKDILVHNISFTEK